MGPTVAPSSSTTTPTTTTDTWPRSPMTALLPMQSPLLLSALSPTLWPMLSLLSSLMVLSEDTDSLEDMELLEDTDWSEDTDLLEATDSSEDTELLAKFNNESVCVFIYINK